MSQNPLSPSSCASEGMARSPVWSTPSSVLSPPVGQVRKCDVGV